MSKKSDYEGDRFGDWIVTGRAPASEAKRRWFVRNEVTGEQKIEFQTELKNLGRPVAVLGTAESIGPLGDMVRAANADIELAWAKDLPVDPELTWEDEDYQPVTLANLNAALKIDSSKTPPLSLQITEAVLAAKAMAKTHHEGDHRVELMRGLGEHVEDDVSEAELDERVPAQDPVRASIRKIMGEVGTLRDQINTLGVLADGLLELVDAALKAAITR